MKVEGVRSGSVTAVRRRGGAAVVSAQAVRAPDTITIFGLSDEELTPSVRAVLDGLASQIDLLRREVAALRAQLDEAEALADQDVLVPILNRRAFLRELERAIALTQRHETPASVVYFDLDGFKGVNDRFGHAAGDAALRHTAEQLWRNVREEDVVARLGGDEFAVLLLHADRRAAQVKADQLKSAIEAAAVVHQGAAFALRITYGVRQLGGGDEAEHALAEADAAMYLRKPARGA